MFIGLMVTAVVSWYTYSSGLFMGILLGGYFRMLLLLEIVVVLLFSFLFRKLSPTFVTVLYFVYAIINGVTISTIFYLFELNSIVYLFLATAGLFGILAYLGYKTEKDLSNWRTILFPTLIVGIILSLINLLLKNSMLDIVLDWVMLFVFFGITVYDLNKIKNIEYNEEDEQSKKLYVYCAMDLYLDFINIFLRILSLFGKRRN